MRDKEGSNKKFMVHEEPDSGADSVVIGDNCYKKGKSRRGYLTQRILARGAVWVVIVLTKV